MSQPAIRIPPPTPTITFLFTDIEGSTERWEKHREAMSRALERHDGCLRPAIEAHGGTVFKTIGDAFQAAFPDPVAALLAAAEAQRVLSAEDWSACGDGFPALRVRMALHVGAAAADARGDYRTPLLNRVARIESAGNGGQVLLSSDLAALVAGRLPPGFRLRDLGEHRLQDLRHAERIHQVVAEGMPDVVTALRTAGALDARDRIVVRDPAGDAPDTLAGQATVVERTVAETFDELMAVLRGDARTTVLTAEQVQAAARHRAADLAEYRLGRIAAWSQPRYRLDGRFVDLTLLVDQGEEAVAGRWAPKQERYDDLNKLLGKVTDPAVVVLGPPGSGKSTLLRHLELDAAIANLRGEDLGERVTFFIQLNQYKAEHSDDARLLPGDWLAARWSAAHPNLPALGELLSEGRVILLLDALNEMPAASEREFRARIGSWKDWLVRLAKEQPGNRVVFSCRTLDYSAPLSTPALRVPQVQIEALSDVQIVEFLKLYSPARGAEIWEAIAGTPQLDALRSPFFLALLADQVEGTGELAEDRAGLFTGFVRQALRREVERDNPLFALEELLARRDLRRIAQWQWGSPYELPEQGALVPKLAELAYGMQDRAADGGASQVRLGYDAALDLVGHARDEDILRAGLAISVLDEEPAADEVLYRHQLIQEYFAARVLSRDPRPDLVAKPWRVAEIQPSVRELIDSVPAGETLPPLPQTGWEETTVLAAVMTPDAEAFVRGVMGTNLALAGRCAAQARVGVGVKDFSPLPAAFIDELRWALVNRSRDPDADLRDRIACGLAVGELGDPRFERREGPYGPYLMPPLVRIAGGVYSIGEDEPLAWYVADTDETFIETGHTPRHEVEIAAMDFGQFLVTNAEWRAFMEAGGYQDKQWWDTADAEAWRRGELANEGQKEIARMYQRMYVKNPDLFDQMVDQGRFDSQEEIELRRAWQLLDEAAFEAALNLRWPARRATEPERWRDHRFNAASQPVVGISWYEARAYCNWLSAQTGLAFRLPTEVEWEAAARGMEGRLFAYGDDFSLAKGNTCGKFSRLATPVGVFVEGDTPQGVSDMAGNVSQWMSNLWGGEGQYVTSFGYPYDASDGREEPNAGPEYPRVLRGGSWDNDHDGARATIRDEFKPGGRNNAVGFRCCVTAGGRPSAPGPLSLVFRERGSIGSSK